MNADPRETLRAVGAAAWADVDMADVRGRAARRRLRRRAGTLAAALALPVLVAGLLLLAPRDGQRPSTLLGPVTATGEPSPSPSPSPSTAGPARTTVPAPTITSAPSVAPPEPAPEPAPVTEPAPPASSPQIEPPAPAVPPAGAPSAPAAAAQAPITLEAEAADLTDPMKVFADPLAQGGRYVGVEDGTGEPRQGEAAFAFEIAEPGRFALWARVQGPDTASNSFFASLDGADKVIWHVPGPGDEAVTSTWAWAPVALGDGPQGHIVELAAGSHRLRIVNRQDGTRLDRVLVTTDLSAAPAP